MEYTYAGVTFVAEPATEGYTISVTDWAGTLDHFDKRDAGIIAMYFNDHLPMKFGEDSYPITITQQQVMDAIEQARRSLPTITVEQPKSTTIEIQSGKLGHKPKL